jgi:SM-20-related protein
MKKPSLLGRLAEFLRSRIPRRRRMVPISRRLRYDDAYLTPKIPEEFRILNRFDSDYPFFLASDALPPAVCDEIVSALRAQGSVGQMTLSKPGESNEPGSTAYVDRKVRNTEKLILTPAHATAYAKAFARLKPEIEHFFGVRLTGNDGVQVLGYPPGGHYRMHADNCAVVPHPDGRNFHWVGDMSHRLISSILFLTESVEAINGPNECTGGEVTFNYLLDERNKPFRIRPRKGLFLAFPSNPYFTHQVHPVKEGYRVTLVDWYSGEMRNTRRD